MADNTKNGKAENFHESLGDMNKQELISRARAAGVKGYSRMNKNELARAIEKNQK